MGVILNAKLNWKDNIEHRAKKRYIAFYACKKTFSKKIGSSTKNGTLEVHSGSMPNRYIGLFGVVACHKQGLQSEKTSRSSKDCLYGRNWVYEVVSHGYSQCPLEPIIYYLREGGCRMAKQYGHCSLLDALQNGLDNFPTDYIFSVVYPLQFTLLFQSERAKLKKCSGIAFDP